MRLRLALLLLSCVAAVALGELAVRLLGLEVRLSHGMRYEPALGWTADPAARRADGVVEPGFRHQVESFEKEPGTRRLLVIGDSFTMGAALPLRLTFVGLLGELLAAERVEVVSLAAGGWGTGQQLRALERYGLAYQPDLAVLQLFPHNDLCDNSIGLAGSCGELDLYRPYAVAGRDGLEFRTASRLRGTLRASRLFRVVENRAEAWLRARPSPPAGRPFLHAYLEEDAQSEAIRDGWRSTEEVLRVMVAALRARGVPLWALTLPHPDSLDEAAWRETHPQPGLRVDYGERRFAAQLRALDVPVESLRERVARAPWLPADHFFPLPDDPHLNEVGHELVAEIVLERLVAGGHVSESALERLRARRTGFEADWIEQRGLVAAVRGLGRTRHGGGRPLRTALGPEVTVVFASPTARALGLCFGLADLEPEAEIGLTGPSGEWRLRADRSGGLRRCVELGAGPGRNRVAFALPGPAAGVRWWRLTLDER